MAKRKELKVGDLVLDAHGSRCIVIAPAGEAPGEKWLARQKDPRAVRCRNDPWHDVVHLSGGAGLVTLKLVTYLSPASAEDVQTACAHAMPAGVAVLKRALPQYFSGEPGGVAPDRPPVPTPAAKQPPLQTRASRTTKRPQVSVISTRELSRLPAIEPLRRLFQSLAVLDALLCADWQGRYYSFNSAWAPGEMMGSMRNGSGDELHAVFDPAGCFIHGFAHESPMSPFARKDKHVAPGMFEGVPDAFAKHLDEPAFEATTATTFCIWRLHTQTAWQRGPVTFPKGRDPDGSAQMLSNFDGKPETYRAWATDYFELDDLSVDAVRRIFAHEPLSEQLAEHVGSERSLSELGDELKEIGYPVATG